MRSIELPNSEKSDTKWADRFQKTGSTLAAHGLYELAEQLQELKKKADSQELFIAFCGHFSAGKSTLLNSLLGADILPSSPIPTTANVVAVRSGQSRAVVTLLNEEQVEFPLEDLESVKQYCVTQTDVKEVSLYYPTELLPPGVTLLDTPGIDSTDEVHQLATESVLYLADIVFYVMDYNHVQSELNFTFAKELHDRGKQLYLVVNQIDKHIEFELDFESYKEGVARAFEDWGVTPKAFFYTSLREMDHPENEFTSLENCLKDLFARREAIIAEGFSEESRQILCRIQTELLRRQTDKRAALEEEIGLEDHAVEQDRQLLNSLLSEQTKRTEGYQKAIQELEASVLAAIRDARLFGFATTELAADYLESLADNFKVGWFNSRSKREAEQTSRLNRFVEELRNEVNSQLQWPIRDLLIKGAQQVRSDLEEFTKLVMDMTVEINAEVLQKQVKSGGIGRDYAYRYREDVTNAIKELYRRQVLQQLAKLQELIHAEDSGRRTDEAEQFAHLNRLISAKEKVAELDREIEEFLKQISLVLGVNLAT